MIKDVLEKWGGVIVDKIGKNLDDTGTTASGKTKNSLKFEVTDKDQVTTLSVKARKFFKAVETGTKPSDKRPSPEYIESLEEWRAKKGVKAPAWAIATKNLQEGSTLYRKGGRMDIYSNVLEEILPELKKDIAKDLKNGVIGR